MYKSAEAHPWPSQTSKVNIFSLHKKMKKSLMENFIFCVVFARLVVVTKLTFLTILTTADIWRALINPFNATGLLPNQKLSDIFRGYRKTPVAWNGLNVSQSMSTESSLICKLYQNITSKLVFVIVFEIDCNLFIVLPIRLKTCRSNNFFIFIR